MPTRIAFFQKSVVRYGLVFAAITVAVLLRLPFTEILASKAAYITFYPAVMITAILCGFWMGILTTVLAALASAYWVLPPVGQFHIASEADAISLAIFVIMGVLISGIAEQYHKTRKKAAEYEAEMARYNSEAQYRELVQNANSAIIRWRRDGTICFFNEFAQRFFGYSEEEIIGKNISIIVPETDSGGGDMIALVEEVVNQPDKHINNINENVLRDGTRVWMSWTNKSILDEQGQVVEILAVGSDITDLKKAEDSLRESEAREKAHATELQAFIDAVPGIVFIAHDTECKKITGSNSTYEFLRLPGDGNVSMTAPDDEKPMSFRITKNGKELLPEELPIQMAAKGLEIRDYELDIEYNNGDVRTIRGNVSPVSDENGNPRGAVGAFLDVTEQKRIVAELAKSRTEAELHATDLQAVLDAVPAAVWIAHDPECSQITGNAYADEIIMNVPRGGNISRSAPPNKAAVTYKVYRNGIELMPDELPSQVAAATGQVVRDHELSLVFPDGRTVNMIMGAVPLFDNNGVVRGSVAAGSDVTVIKQAEETLRESEENYRKLFDSMTEGFLLAELIRDDTGKAVDFRILEANRAYETVLGCPREEAIGRTLLEMFPGLPHDRFQAIVHVAETGERATYEGLFAPTGRYYYNNYYSPRQDQLAGIFTDITLRINTETTLREAEAHKQDFYRRTILAATEGKLIISEAEFIKELAGPAIISWNVGTKDDMSGVIEETRLLACEFGMEEQRSYEFKGCITEAVTNTVKHAQDGVLSFHKNANNIVCIISDSGPGIGTLALPEVALTRGYSTAGTMGLGYKLMIHFADKVYLTTGPAGTIVAIEMKLHKDTRPFEINTPSQIAAWID